MRKQRVLSVIIVDQNIYYVPKEVVIVYQNLLFINNAQNKCPERNGLPHLYCKKIDIFTLAVATRKYW